MNTTNRNASLVVSVDVPLAQEESPVIAELLNLFRRHRVAALWSLEFSRPAGLVERIRGAWSGHEFGVLANADWAGPRTTRTIFHHGLAERVECAKQMSIAVTAIAFRDGDTPGHYDLMVKHQLALLRCRTDQVSGANDSLQPRVARYGIWETRPTLVVPVASRWSLPWTARRMLQQAEESHRSVHLAIDAVRLGQNRSAGIGSLDYLIKLASAHRDAGKLQMVSFGELLESYAPRRESGNCQSVLRAA